MPNFMPRVYVVHSARNLSQKTLKNNPVIHPSALISRTSFKAVALIVEPRHVISNNVVF